MGTYINGTPFVSLSNSLSDELAKLEKGFPRALIELLLTLGEPKFTGLWDAFPVCDELTKVENGFAGALTVL